LVCLFRSNGIIVAGAFNLVALILSNRRKSLISVVKFFCAGAFAVLAFIGADFGLTKAFNARSAPDAKLLSIPIQQIAAVYYYGGVLSESENAYFSQIHHPNFWKTHYDPISADPLTLYYFEGELTPFTPEFGNRITANAEFLDNYFSVCSNNFGICARAYWDQIKNFFIPIASGTDVTTYAATARIQDDLFVNMYSGNLQLNSVIDQPSELNTRIAQLYSDLTISSSGYTLQQFSDFVYQTNSKVYDWPLAAISDAIFQSLPVRYTLHLVFDNPSLYVYVLLVGLLIALIRRQRTATLIFIPTLIYFLGLLATTPVADFRYVYPLIPLLLVATLLLFQKKPVRTAQTPEVPADADNSDASDAITPDDNSAAQTADSENDGAAPDSEYQLPTVISARGAIPPTVYNAMPKTQSPGAKGAASGVSPNVSVPPTVIPARKPEQPTDDDIQPSEALADLTKLEEN
jgi:hypothetical protein